MPSAPWLLRCVWYRCFHEVLFNSYQGRLFQSVDQIWREHMQKTFDDPSVLSVARRAGFLDALLDANDKLDTIQKGLNDYLETKRLVGFICETGTNEHARALFNRRTIFSHQYSRHCHGGTTHACMSTRISTPTVWCRLHLKKKKNAHCAAQRVSGAFGPTHRDMEEEICCDTSLTQGSDSNMRQDFLCHLSYRYNDP